MTTTPFHSTDFDNAPREAEVSGRAVIFGAIAGALSLLGLCLLALGDVRPTSGDQLTLFVLGVAALICVVGNVLGVNPLRRLFASREAATWALMLAFFVVYGMARRAGPQDGWRLNTTLLPDTPLPIPYAARLVWLGALLSLPAWSRALTAPTRAILASLLLVALFGLGSFLFLRRFYAVGETEILNPKPLLDTLLQASEYGALALCCTAAGANILVRRWVLSALPILLLMIWARHQFRPIPLKEDDE